MQHWSPRCLPTEHVILCSLHPAIGVCARYWCKYCGLAVEMTNRDFYAVSQDDETPMQLAMLRAVFGFPIPDAPIEAC